MVGGGWDQIGGAQGSAATLHDCVMVDTPHVCYNPRQVEHEA